MKMYCSRQACINIETEHLTCEGCEHLSSTPPQPHNPLWEAMQDVTLRDLAMLADMARGPSFVPADIDDGHVDPMGAALVEDRKRRALAAWAQADACMATREE